MGVSRAYGEIFDSLVVDSGLESNRGVCSAIRRILFGGFKPAWLSENQKFDFSFSSADAFRLRLSVNDYGEKGAFERKVVRIFKLFENAYDPDKLTAILNAARPTRRFHQTTFGLDWPGRDPKPRLKIYFEELRHKYTARARAELLRSICRAGDIQSPPVDERHDLAAICVDFMPAGSVMLKTYIYSSWDSIRNKKSRAGFGDFINMLSVEKRAFFYQTLRFNRRAGIESRKLYKVYEVRQIEDYTPALAEIYKTVGNFGKRRDILNINRYRKLAERNGALWYPVLCSMDIDRRGKINIDSYFSIR